MKRPNFHKRYIFLASVLLVVGGCALACFLWMRAEQRQYALNRALIEALNQGNLKRAIDLVEVGANPNTLLQPLPAPSWRDLLNQMLHRSTPSPKNVFDDTSAFAVKEGRQSEIIHLLKTAGATE